MRGRDVTRRWLGESGRHGGSHGGRSLSGDVSTSERRPAMSFLSTSWSVIKTSALYDQNFRLFPPFRLFITRFFPTLRSQFSVRALHRHTAEQRPLAAIRRLRRAAASALSRFVGDIDGQEKMTSTVRRSPTNGRRRWRRTPKTVTERRKLSKHFPLTKIHVQSGTTREREREGEGEGHPLCTRCAFYLMGTRPPPPFAKIFVCLPTLL